MEATEFLNGPCSSDSEKVVIAVLWWLLLSHSFRKWLTSLQRSGQLLVEITEVGIRPNQIQA